MKKILICLTCLLVNLYSAEKVSITGKFEINSFYNSNIVKLSATDLDLFKANSKPEKFNLNSTDDQVVGVSGELAIKHDYFLNHTQINKIVFKSDNYLNNSQKSNYSIGAEIRQFFTKDFDAILKYRFYPEIYVARYKSETEQTGEYHDYDYAKNSYAAELNYDLNKVITFNYGLEYSESFYNKYFTEYDCKNISNSFGVNAKLFNLSKVGAEYALEYSDADGKDAYSNLSAGSFQAKDASYQENSYKLSLNLPFKIAEEKFILESNYILQDRFFQSNESGDIYHLARHDRTHMLNLSCGYLIYKNLKVESFYKYENRDTNSDYNEVEESKRYNYYNLGIGLSTSL